MRITHYHAFPGFDVLELPPTLQLLSVCGLNHVSWSLEKSIKPIHVPHFYLDWNQEAFFAHHKHLRQMENRHDVMADLMKVKPHLLILL